MYSSLALWMEVKDLFIAEENVYRYDTIDTFPA